MTSLLKFTAVPAVALAGALSLTSTASAEEATPSILVTEMDQWQADATRRLNRALERNPINRRGAPAPGIVQLTFSLDEDGRPKNIAVRQNSANRAALESATYAVRRMGDLSDAPVANVGQTKFIANVIFADTLKERRELAQSLAASERARLALAEEGQTYIAIGG